ncbi:MAG: hypothetical protein LBO08_00420 [Rickettsiales bacterium]|jgi:hypothetical protein|nr:hypothetical protein [Rickettsiales bacterium]
MTKQQNNLLIKILVSLAIFLICFFSIDVIVRLFSYFLVKVLFAALITYAIVQIADKLGLPGFAAAPKTGKKK